MRLEVPQHLGARVQVHCRRQLAHDGAAAILGGAEDHLAPVALGAARAAVEEAADGEARTGWPSLS